MGSSLRGQGDFPTRMDFELKTKTKSISDICVNSRSWSRIIFEEARGKWDDYTDIRSLCVSECFERSDTVDDRAGLSL